MANTASFNYVEDDAADLGDFAEGVRLWAKIIATAAPDKRPAVFRNVCVAEGADFVRNGAPRGDITKELILLADRHELVDALGGREVVEKIIGDGLADADAPGQNGRDKTADNCLSMLDVSHGTACRSRRATGRCGIASSAGRSPC